MLVSFRKSTARGRFLRALAVTAAAVLLLILLSAVAPHTLNSRSIVLSDSVTVTIEVVPGRFGEGEGPAEAVFDGDTSAALPPGSRVVVKRSDKKTHIMKINHTSFVEIIRQKLR